MPSLSNNRELYEYLLFWAAALKGRKSDKLSDALILASRHAAGMSTEFLGESRNALRRVLEEEGGVLAIQERADLTAVLKQLDDALDRR